MANVVSAQFVSVLCDMRTWNWETASGVFPGLGNVDGSRENATSVILIGLVGRYFASRICMKRPVFAP